MPHVSISTENKRKGAPGKTAQSRVGSKNKSILHHSSAKKEGADNTVATSYHTKKEARENKLKLLILGATEALDAHIITHYL